MSDHALLKLSRALHGADTLEVVMQRVRAAITESSRFNRAYIHLLAPDQKTFEIVGFALPNDELVRKRLATIDVSRDLLLQKVFNARDPFVVEDLRQEPLADQAQVEFFGNRTAIVIPMFEGDARIGPLVVPSYADQGVLVPTEQELDFFVQVASLLAVVIGRLRAEQARREVEERAARHLRTNALGRMAGEVAHDVNNVLVTILANAELAAEELVSHPVHELLVDVQAAAQRAARLTRKLLAISSGQLLTKRAVPVHALLESATKLARPSLAPNVELRQVVHPGVDSVVGDPLELERVFMNLLVNARDAVGLDGQITVEAETVTVDAEYVAAQGSLRPGRYLRVSISDDGEGMSRETQSRIFEPFFTTKPAEHGTGLGLSVVEGIVRQHDGFVHVYSELGSGTTFKVYLPLTEKESATDKPAGAATRRAPEQHSAASRSASILIVDDDETVRRTVELILQRAGYAVRSLSTAAEALEHLPGGCFDLLITDVVLTGGDGMQLAEEARRSIPGLPVLFMTGYARGKLNDLGLPQLSKPFAASELLLLVRHTLGGEVR
jgi:signal transduction histidine kinase/CheY-like chemotaxis protein